MPSDPPSAPSHHTTTITSGPFSPHFPVIYVSCCSSLTLSSPPVDSCCFHQKPSFTSMPLFPYNPPPPCALFPQFFARFSNIPPSLSFPALFFSCMNAFSGLPAPRLLWWWLITRCWTLPSTPNKVNHWLLSTGLPLRSAFETTLLYAEPLQHWRQQHLQNESQLGI